VAKYFESLGGSWIRRLPECRLFRNEEERNAALILACKRTTGTVAFWLPLAILWTAAFILTRRLLPPFIPNILLGPALSLPCGAACLYPTLWLKRRRIKRLLREQLIGLGIPVCLHCGYNVRGQTEPRCPECGREFDPGLLSTGEQARPSGGATENS
jgi:hypothetical protein